MRIIFSFGPFFSGAYSFCDLNTETGIFYFDLHLTKMYIKSEQKIANWAFLIL